jgi:hypothetical protein
MFGKKTASDFDPSKKESFGYQSKIFEKEINSYTKDVESFNKQNDLYSQKVDEFNKKYSGKELAKKDYQLLLKNQKLLKANKLYWLDCRSLNTKGQAWKQDKKDLNLNIKIMRIKF